jgi:Tfp pilus assembly protein PilO
MKNKALSKIMVFLLSVTALLSLSAWVFLVYKSMELRKEIASLGTEARDKSSESAYLSSIRNTLRDSKEELAVIDGRFISKDSVPELINSLENKAAAERVNANFGSINVESPEEAHPTLRIKMTGSGTWERALSFITLLDSLPYVSRIENLNLTKGGGDGQGRSATTTWNFNMDIVQYLTN